MEIQTRANAHKSPVLNCPEQFEEAPITRSIDLGDPNNDDRQSISVAGGQPLALELGHPVDVVRPTRGFLVDDALVRAIHAYGAAVNDPANAGLEGGVEHVAHSAYIDVAEVIVAHVHLVLRSSQV